MSHSRTKKSLIASTIFLLASCSQRPEAVCHQWTADEKAQLISEDSELPPDAALHGLIRDYERLCAQ